MTRILHTLPAALVATIALLATAPTHAGTTGGSMTATFTAVANGTCSASVTNMAFGTLAINYQRDVTTEASQTATLTITCSANTPYSYWANTGLNYGNSTLRMSKDGNTTLPTVRYTIANIPNGTTYPGSGSPLSATGNGGAQAYTIYGKVPLQGTIGASGSFSDTVTFTIDY